MFINWTREENLIKQNYLLTDNELKYGLRVMQHAQKIYNNTDYIPSTILLVDRKGNVFHTIKTGSNLYYSEKVQLPSIFTVNKLIGVASVVVGIVALVLLTRKR